MAYEYTRFFINDNCIARESANSKRLLRKGANPESTNPADFNRWMFVIKPALYDPRVMKEVADHFFVTYPIELGSYQIAGMEHASTAIVTTLLLEAHRRGIDLHGFSIRESKKTYGTRTWFEGIPDPKRKTILVDDISSQSRSTFLKGKDILVAEGLTVQDAYCIINLGFENELSCANAYIKISSMFNKKDFTLVIDDA